MDVGISNAVAEKAVMHGLIPGTTQHYQPSCLQEIGLFARDALCELMIEALVRPGGNFSNCISGREVEPECQRGDEKPDASPLAADDADKLHQAQRV